MPIASKVLVPPFIPGHPCEVFSFGRWYPGTVFKVNRTRVEVTYVTGTGAKRTKAFPAAKVRTEAHGFKPPAQEVAPAPAPERWTRARFVEFLRETLIPDLRDSGWTFTADDFEMACEFIEDRNLDAVVRKP